MRGKAGSERRLSMRVSEIFGTSTDNDSAEARGVRSERLCPFRGSPCTKVRKHDPVGVCSLSQGQQATVVCPVRFLQDQRIFRDAGSLAFGSGVEVVAFPEFKLLTVEGTGRNGKDKKIGKVDFLIGQLVNGAIVDFAALEVQAVYSSGGGVEDAFRSFMDGGAPTDEELGVDFRSSAQKRLVPQLELKVPVFRRWGKKFFVAIDTTFYAALPEFGSVSEGNSEVTWLAYPITQTMPRNDLVMDAPEVHFTEWAKVQHALKEGEPPSGPDEVQRDLTNRISGNKLGKYSVVTT